MFISTLTNVLITLFYMIPGFILRKMHKASEKHLPTLSGILLYICTPFLVINSFLKLDFSMRNVILMVGFFFATFILQSLFILILWLLLRKKFDNIKYRLFTIGSIIGNVGFFGFPVITALMPDSPEVACYSATYILSMNVLTFTVGIFALTGNKKFVSVKGALINPATVGLVFAIPLYVFGLRDIIPTALVGAVSNIAGLSTPLCMFILGIRLASVPVKNIFACKTAYLTSLMKLVVFPLFCFSLVSLLPVPDSFLSAIVILAGTPCATAILSLAEIHESEPSMAANCVFLSTLSCFITIPLLTLLL